MRWKRSKTSGPPQSGQIGPSSTNGLNAGTDPASSSRSGSSSSSDSSEVGPVPTGQCCRRSDGSAGRNRTALLKSPLAIGE